MDNYEPAKITDFLVCLASIAFILLTLPFAAVLGLVGKAIERFRMWQ